MGSENLALSARRVAGGVLAALLFEIVLRFTTYGLTYDDDAELGPAPAEGGPYVYGREGFGRSRWSARGVRLDVAPPSTSPVRRVVVFGDSQVEALMVDDEDVLSAVASRALRRSGITDVAVWSMGHSGASAADVVRVAPVLRDDLGAIRVVVVLDEQDLGRDAFNPARAHFVRDPETGALAFADVPPAPVSGQFLASWRRTSALVAYAGLRAGEFRVAAASEPPLFFAADEHAGADEAPSASLDILEFERDRLAPTQVTFLFLSAMPPTAFDADARDACLEHRLDCLFAADAFDGVPPGAAPYGFSNSHWNQGHLNALGHRLLGEMLAEHLASHVGRALL